MVKLYESDPLPLWFQVDFALSLRPAISIPPVELIKVFQSSLSGRCQPEGQMLFAMSSDQV